MEFFVCRFVTMVICCLFSITDCYGGCGMVLVVSLIVLFITLDMCGFCFICVLCGTPLSWVCLLTVRRLVVCVY